MKAFIKSIDEKARKVILTGWMHPTKTNDNDETVMKPEVEWTAEEDKLVSSNSKAVSSNSKAINAIFSAVDVYQFKLISTFEVAKEA